MSAGNHLISLGILGKIIMKEKKGVLSGVEPQLEVEGGGQATRKVEDLQKIVSTKRFQAENVDKKSHFCYG